MFLTNESSTDSYVFDSSASTHMTDDLDKLLSLSPYYCPDMICVRNSIELQIKFFGSYVIPASSHNLMLKGILVSPANGTQYSNGIHFHFSCPYTSQ